VSSECGAPVLPVPVYAGSGSGSIERKECVVNYDEENKLLADHGFHLAYDPEDAAESPKEANPKGEVWQLGSRNNPVKEPEFFTREQALKEIAERYG
jgi:hypothetical protein